MAPNEKPSANAEGDALPANMVAQAARAVAGNSGGSSQGHESEEVPTLTVDDHDDLEAPPPYGDSLNEVYEENTQFGVDTKATIADDGRVNININQRTSRLSSLLAPALRNQLDIQDKEPAPPPYIPASLGGEPGQAPPPPLNIVIQVVGSRGDVQPFVALGKVLKERYGHRVRLATHNTFRQFVTENGLEFFNIGGDPAELMAFMVKNPGLMPGFDTLRSGDVGKRRKEIGEMVKGCWRSCIESGDGSDMEVTGETQEQWMDNTYHAPGSRPTDPKDMPFVCDAIIANPPSFAHVHCAEKLGCPLHMMFTMPYSPTQAFPHPLANIQSSNADTHLTNYLSYAMVETMTWQGLGDVINRFRHKSLGLEPVSLLWAPGMLARLRIPYTYCFSPSLIPKPKDWANHITLSGFYFLSLASNYTPEPELKAFLDAGPPPIYIGFGSIVVDDPTAMTKMIFEAVQKTGQRALVSKGWGGVGADELGIPEGVMMLGNVPHDWLFNHVSCVVHHGGAGTTAAGIACGKPTVIVPFFGDQPWWGGMVARAGAGPEPVAYKELTAEKLAENIKLALEPNVKERAQELADSISHEKGSEQGASFFHQFLKVDEMRCTIAPSRAAVWRLKRTNVKFSAFAATVLANEGLLDFKDLKLYRSREYELDDGPWDPITGGGTAIIGTISSVMMGVADMPVETLKALKIHPDAKQKSKVKQTDSENLGTETGLSRKSTDMSSSENMLTSTASTRSPSTTAPTSPQSASSSQFNLNESLSKLHASDDIASEEPKPAGKKGMDFKSMGLALRDQLNDHMARKAGEQQGDTRGRSSNAGEGHNRRSGSGSPHPPDAVGTAINTGKGVSRIAGASFRSPMDFTLAIAKGFRNAPKLYGDETVRKSEPITDFKSGIRAATKEFGFGMYDGITGLVTQPMEGAKKDGAAGFLKGVGKGIGGVVLKPGAAVWGIPGYTMKGLYKELQAFGGSPIQNYIIAARTAQGYADWHNSNPNERADIIERWITLRGEIKKKKNPDEALRDWAMDQRSKRLTWQDQQKQKIKTTLSSQNFRGALNRRQSTGTEGNEPGREGPTAGSLLSPNTTAQTLPTSGRTEASGATNQSANLPVSSGSTGTQVAAQQVSAATADADLEEAIRRSVAESSRGNAEEDDMIARALKVSITELQNRPQPHGAQGEDEESEAIRSAMAASVAEAENFRRTHPNDNDHDEELEKAIRESMSLHHQSKNKQTAQPQGSAASSDEPPEWNDEDITAAMRMSKHPALRSVFDINASAQAAGDEQVIRDTEERQKSGHTGHAEHDSEDEAEHSGITADENEGQRTPVPSTEHHDEQDGDLEKAMQDSLQSHKQHKDQRSEEDIIMDYVKKQSLMEQKHRDAMTGKSGSGGEGASSSGAATSGTATGDDNEDEDEDLKRAMEMSRSHDDK